MKKIGKQEALKVLLSGGMVRFCNSETIPTSMFGGGPGVAICNVDSKKEFYSITHAFSQLFCPSQKDEDVNYWIEEA